MDYSARWVQEWGFPILGDAEPAGKARRSTLHKADQQDDDIKRACFENGRNWKEKGCATEPEM